ncbi:hypothetical protein M3148_09305 [Georgenia satyanarayanai]|uniref:hypothetical protein n=1 Tax=Georgenia satyanarayanai TaxID=860221 RepID=UPI0020402E5F|nr:hypothetical protein [Georgenia satyanarayanai]MCM3661184.1 hypothetical protein [Georgenia satyanarayanai]
MATVAIAATGFGAGMANAYSFKEAAVTAKDGSATVASATTKMEHGYSSLSGNIFHKGVMTIRDRSAGDGRAVYGKLTGQKWDYVVQRRPGGSIKYLAWIGTGQKETSRTSSTLSTVPTVSWDYRTHYGLKTFTNVCVDIRLQPDNCAGISATTLY